MTIGKTGRLAAALIAGTLAGAAGPAHAERINNPVAEFAGLDKITGRIISFDVYIGEKVQFGALQVTPRVCYSRPPTEQPQTDAFVEVDEITLNNEVRRIFTGWMFAASPGLHAVEHPVYDVWLTDCKQSSNVPPPDNYDGPPVIQKVAPNDPLGDTPRDPNAPPPNIPRDKPQVQP
ncbi:hypothetical protein C8N35_105282 [Breoghania corrubedonensis]|uniref:DUF2155 domain-containing protein n=1 Tax=Breoghania corrubedonensis TaxID=665038 RepID=A0A2T5V960_9HYPH|nr:DUF2155 domain-containing protein [Breoghania corrubedonensis]PTW60278.1 hypothetical protein C8N35_105282 [Breoghania corrubedonensis]